MPYRLIPCMIFIALCGGAAAPGGDVIIADFEGPDYGGWTVTGTAFGAGPARGTLPNQMPVSGYVGKGLVNSYAGGDGATGTLTSPEFTIQRRYINFLIGGGMHPGETCVNLLVEGKIVRTQAGPNDRPGGSERLDWATWNVRDLQGRRARIEIVDRATGGWGHINVDEITMSDKTMAQEIKTGPLYKESYRPQFHFTARRNWLNDPNGLVYYRGEYHLFFQHNPLGMTSGNLTWGHAISADLVHWTQVANAIEPDARGPIWSGSAVVDTDNTAGFQKGGEKTIVAIYTAAGGTSPESEGQPFTQCIAYSTDRGRTWTKYSGNPVIPHIIGGDRDPKVVWYEPARRWIMALYLDGHDYGFFSSPDLVHWTHLHDITVPDCGECPDFFPMSVDGKPDEMRWVFTAANGRYLVGSFDGARFTPDGGPSHVQQVDFGANYYAVQTFSDIPRSDGRRIQIAWMAGGSYPQMPFNQQMSFPCTLTLRHASDGLRLFRWPVREIRKLYDNERTWKDVSLGPDEDPLSALKGELWDLEATFLVGKAAELGFVVRGEPVTYSAADHTLTCLGRSAPLEPENGRVRIRVLADRTSLEVFGNGGRVSLTSCFLPRLDNRTLGVFAHGGPAKLVSLSVRSLRSAWPAPDSR